MQVYSCSRLQLRYWPQAVVMKNVTIENFLHNVAIFKNVVLKLLNITL